MNSQNIIPTRRSRRVDAIGLKEHLQLFGASGLSRQGCTGRPGALADVQRSIFFPVEVTGRAAAAGDN